MKEPMVFGAILFVLDQLTKIFATSYLGNVTLNQGISFGLFSQGIGNRFGQWVLNLGLVVGLLLINKLLAGLAHQSKLAKLGQIFFLTGASSNLVDRFLFSGVRDWLPIPLTKLQNNFADYYIIFGVILLISSYAATTIKK